VQNKKYLTDRINMYNLTLGILAHVDAGKTTLSEALLYTSGAIRAAGRVDHGDAFLDTDAMEKERGITIFAKQAVLSLGRYAVTLLDTPGHADFSAETERTLDVLDYAVLCVSGSEGVQSHTRTLMRLLERYHVPVFIFVNKMDQPGTDKARLLAELQKEFGGECVDFSAVDSAEWLEETASCDETLMNTYLETGMFSHEAAAEAIRGRKLFPCCFGSALKLDGIQEFAGTMAEFFRVPVFGESFGAKVFKVSRDEQGIRLTHMKITGGSLKVRDVLKGTDRRGAPWEEKVSQLRVYNGARFEAVNEAACGTVCAAAGLTHSWQGEGLGACEDAPVPFLKPVLHYQLLLPPETDAALLYPKLTQLEDEDPEVTFVWKKALREIDVEVMGEVQTEILTAQIRSRFGTEAAFGKGTVLYKETITDTVEGVGHYEPLRHYAEVHLLMEPAGPGSGLLYGTDCSEDILAVNWQKLVLTHLKEREFPGVLTGSPVTDMKITLVTGRASVKHTEGGDFREATYRAVRQGLMQAHSVLLEPLYEYRLEVPSSCVGRAMNDLQKMAGQEGEFIQNGDTAIFTGKAPVVEMQDYYREVNAYSGGAGRLSLAFCGYGRCHNEEEVCASAGYDPREDAENPSCSVFCGHGAAYIVPWDEVTSHMHLENVYRPASAIQERTGVPVNMAVPVRHFNDWIDPDEVDAILSKTSSSNRKERGEKGGKWRYSRNLQGAKAPEGGKPAAPPAKRTVYADRRDEMLLVDGYNVIFAWEGLSSLAAENIDAARGKLLDILSNYQGMKHCGLIAVFDAYRIKEHPVEAYQYHNIEVVYTKTAQTADAYIEKFAYENKGKYRITVVTSDGLEQIIIRSQGCALLSSRDFEESVRLENERMREYLESMHE